MLECGILEEDVHEETVDGVDEDAQKATDEVLDEGIVEIIQSASGVHSICGWSHCALSHTQRHTHTHTHTHRHTDIHIQNTLKYSLLENFLQIRTCHSQSQGNNPVYNMHLP